MSLKVEKVGLMIVNSEQIGLWRQELLGYLNTMAKFHEEQDYVSILGDLSAMSARASGMRQRIVRSNNDESKRFRLDEIDPFLKEVDRQFKDYSRSIAVVSQEWNNS
jgi:hypothetical protein